MAKKNGNWLWWDKKRYWGMPLSFTTYAVSKDRLFRESGFLNRHYEEILLYRVRDITMTTTLGQRLFGVGTITVYSSDKSAAQLDLINIRVPRKVKELIHELTEQARERHRFRIGEYETVGDDESCC